MPLSDFRDALGTPGTGVHFHVGGIAVVDVILTVAAAHLIAKQTGQCFYMVLFLLLGMGVVAHRLFRVRTTVDMWLFGVVSTSRAG